MFETNFIYQSTSGWLVEQLFVRELWADYHTQLGVGIYTYRQNWGALELCFLVMGGVANTNIHAPPPHM